MRKLFSVSCQETAVRRDDHVSRQLSGVSVKPRRGFTLIELLVSLSILGVITGQMLANFRAGQNNSELRFAAEILVNQLRDLQTNALTGRTVRICTGGTDDLEICGDPGECGDGSCDARIPEGYGIRLTSATPAEYLLFADTDADGVYDAGEELTTQPYVSAGTVSFDAANVVLPVDIVFTPPFGDITVNGAETGVNEVEITLGHMNGDQERHVTINRVTGRIDHDR